LREDKGTTEVVREDAPQAPAIPSDTTCTTDKVRARFRPENIQTLYPDAVVPIDDELIA
jgi:hypothetical protein